jgi:mono/diheme cytochrome c family protein
MIQFKYYCYCVHLMCRYSHTFTLFQTFYMIKKFLFTTSIIFCAFWLLSLQDGSPAESIKRGKEVYTNNCLSCHQESGAGIEGLYPPLAKSDYLMKDPKKSIGIILNGQTEEITVNGKKYSTPMPAQNYLTDEQIADVINYTTNSWGNKTKTIIKPEMVKAERK